ncbi:TetR/AcrR family transcriptional regulator [Actinomadura darangshiensis]|uniref:TetR/AcrR family transcriptional regulator n=1 Tax=Actinomadura darangshiensis TaxID=705336 RepID=A0A4R4ZW41_9ACTN|nr:TetR/AcrR family transcriptional regulator [Actinomadura darangshiensis]TDD62289.1 TetR/AcrR family transcriptional regulator [Actinomadura darangshiensis]
MVPAREGAARGRDRDATEESLRAAAVALLRRGGVLAGLNLRQVADEARVNRGLVYQYFGSRRSLLRSALFHRSRPNAEDAVDAAGLPLRERLARLFWTSLRHPEPVRLATLLVLDGDDRPRVLLNRGASREDLAAEAARGELPVEDVEAVQAAIASTIYGYTLLREHLAREIGLPEEELDKRMAECVEAMFTRRRD